MLGLIYLLILLVFFSTFAIGCFRFPYHIVFDQDKQGISGYVVEVKIGTSGQSFHAIFYPNFRELIVVDSECGMTAKNCPRYCEDPLFLLFYCEPTCQQLTRQNRPVYCLPFYSNLTEYNRSMSTTSINRTDRDEWHAQLTDTYPLVAEYVQDVLILDPKSNLSIPAFQFLSGLRMDSKLFKSENALIGMAPGSDQDPNFVLRLHREGKLKQPVTSFSVIDMITGYGKGVLGLEDHFKCDQWTHFPTVEENTWVFEFEEVEVMNVRMGKTRVLWDPANSSVDMPKEAFDLFVRNGVISFDPKDGIQARCNETRGWVRFTNSEGRTLTLEHEDLFYYDPEFDEWCPGFVGVTDHRRYSTTPAWSIGSFFALHYCQTYDFGSRRLGIGFETGSKQKRREFASFLRPSNYKLGRRVRSNV